MCGILNRESWIFCGNFNALMSSQVVGREIVSQGVENEDIVK